LFSRLTKLDPGPIAPVSAVLTLGLGCAAAFGPLVRELGRRAWIALMLVLVLGAAVEYVGVTSGFPFGRYAYTDAWWPTVPLPSDGHFPLQVPFAWFLMAGASYLAASRLPALVAPLGGGLLAAGLDLLMEPVMAGPLGYWRWLDPGPLPGGAPVANFLGWLGTATIAGLAMQALGARRVSESREPVVVLAGHLLLTLGIGGILSIPVR